jgi:hypothetical protein
MYYIIDFNQFEQLRKVALQNSPSQLCYFLFSFLKMATLNYARDEVILCFHGPLIYEARVRQLGCSGFRDYIP